MSNNHFIIAAVSAALADRLQTAVDQVTPGAKAMNRRPDSKRQAQAQQGVDVFLYEIRTNPFLSNNEPAPARRIDENDTDVVRPSVPLAAIDLHYLLTFNGNDNTLEAQRIAGAVVSQLATHPVLTRAEIQLSVDNRDYLEGTVLPRVSEPIVVTPLNLNLEEMSRLWSVLMHEPYSLSMQYALTVVMFRSDPDDPTTRVQGVVVDADEKQRAKAKQAAREVQQSEEKLLAAEKRQAEKTPARSSASSSKGRRA